MENELCKEGCALEHQDTELASSMEDLLLHRLKDITQCIQHSLDGRTKAGELVGQPPQGTEPLVGHGITTESLLTLLEFLRKLGGMHTDRARAWRHAMSSMAQLCSQWQQATRRNPASSTVDGGEDLNSAPDVLPEIMLRVLEDIQCVESRLKDMSLRLGTAVEALSEEMPSTYIGMGKQDETVQEQTDTHCVTQDAEKIHSVPYQGDILRHNATKTQANNQDTDQVDHADTQNNQRRQNVNAEQQDNDSVRSASQPDDGLSSPSSSTGCHLPQSDDEGVQKGSRPTGRSSDSQEEVMEAKTTNRKNEESEGGNQGIRRGWVMKGLVGKSETSGSEDAPQLCYVTAPEAVSKVVTCDLVNGLSSLMVSDLEELVSNVLELRLPDNNTTTHTTKTCFPITVAIPYRSRYRGNYRDILVKVVDQDSRVSYVTPVSTEGSYGGQKGSYAEVRVYTLGVFAVLSCLRKETYTIPRRGLSLKLSIDSRICLDYLPGAFTSPVIAQAVVQPVDPALLSTLKSNVEVYHTVLSTSPLLHLTHPSTQAPRRPLALTLPCPPNPDRSLRAGEEGDTAATPLISHPRPSTAVVHMQGSPLLHRIRAVSASVKSSRELAKEQLVVLGWKEEQWNVLDHVPVKNLQNGLVSFELAEHFERLIVFRLQFPVRSSYLVAVVEEIEASVRRAMVTIVLRRQRQDPHSVVVAALPSRALDWELAKLQGQAYCGPPDPSGEISMAEGDQLLLSFSGNITGMTKGDTRPVDRGAVFLKTITFHNQRKNHEYLTLAVLDPFGNYSSPHYKGLAVFHRIPRAQLLWKGNAAVPAPQPPLGEPVCKLSLTLPKKLRITSRLSSARLLPNTNSDSLSDELLSWLCDELCEEEAALLVLALRVKRSAVQLARLRAAPEPEAAKDRDSHIHNHNHSHSLHGHGPRQAFHALALWRRSLPSHGPKAPLLARCLTRAGRPDLARELLLRERGR